MMSACMYMFKHTSSYCILVQFSIKYSTKKDSRLALASLLHTTLWPKIIRHLDHRNGTGKVYWQLTLGTDQPTNMQYNLKVDIQDTTFQIVTKGLLTNISPLLLLSAQRTYPGCVFVLRFLDCVAGSSYFTARTSLVPRPHPLGTRLGADRNQTLFHGTDPHSCASSTRGNFKVGAH